MSLIDDRGRIAGRVNLVDAAVAVLILVVIPVAYGAYLLFRTPPARLTEVSPRQLYEGPNLRVQVIGENLRPFMRVSFNTTQGRSFLIGSTKYAIIDVPELPPGTYDVVLFDYMQEVSRLPQALTILPLAPVPTVEIEVGGSFRGLPKSLATQVKAGDKLPPTGSPTAEVLSVSGTAPGELRLKAGDATVVVPMADQTELQATLRVKCFVASNPDGSLRCMVAGPQQASVVAPGSNITLPGPQGWMSFQIAEVHSPSKPIVAEAQIRFVVAAEVLALIKAGDVDNSPKAIAPSHAAVLLAINGTRPVTAAEAGPRAPIGGALRVVDATVKVPVEATRGGWSHNEQPFKAGAPFTFETPRYIIQGEVLQVTMPAQGATAGDGAKAPASR